MTTTTTTLKDLEGLRNDIRKELEFLYRLPESLITKSLHFITRFISRHGYGQNQEFILKFGKEIESILLRDKYNSSGFLSSMLTQLYEQKLHEYESIPMDDRIANRDEYNTMSAEFIDSIYAKFDDPEKRKKFLLSPESHFENGNSFHTTQYYFAKRYFQNEENCNKLAVLLANKIESLKGKNNITLVGFRSYTALLLDKTKQLLSEPGRHKVDYVIIEPQDNDFTWEFIPDFSQIRTNFLIILPITCTCSTYIRIRKFLQRQIKYLDIEFPQSSRGRRRKENWIVRRDFINVFLIEDARLDGHNESITVNEDELKELAQKENRNPTPLEYGLSRLYTPFNWSSIEPDAIYFRNDKYENSFYVAHPLIRLYSDLSLPEECTNCFPVGDLSNEKNIFLTHNNFETPNLIQDFPNFGKQRHTSSPRRSVLRLKEKEATVLKFTNLFPNNKNQHPSHHFGHIQVNGASYLNYIRGNVFFEHNRKHILEFYNEVFAEIFEIHSQIKNIVFITPETKHNSTFLEEVINYKTGKTSGAIQQWINSGRKNMDNNGVYILRFDPDNEFIENFMSNYSDLIRDEKSLFIYFVEVISAGKTFKLLSNYLKHYKNIDQHEKELQHGFDYIFSLVDRSPYYTREEILKKLYSKKYRREEKKPDAPHHKNPEEDEVDPANHYITFSRLNTPIIAAAHLGNPLNEYVKVLQHMIKASHLDILKKRIGKELSSRVATKLPEENIFFAFVSALKYFPFEDEEHNNIPLRIFERYKDTFISGKFDLLKMYVAHTTNKILSDTQNPDKLSNLEKKAEQGMLIRFIVNYITDQIQTTREEFFGEALNGSMQEIGPHEAEIIHDTVLKIISRHPFTYYTKIYETVFNYCLKLIEQLRIEIMRSNRTVTFIQIRKLKFLLRRLVNLDSSYIISNQFIQLLQYLYHESPSRGKSPINKLLDRLRIDYDEKVNSLLFTQLLQLISEIDWNNPAEDKIERGAEPEPKDKREPKSSQKITKVVGIIMCIKSLDLVEQVPEEIKLQLCKLTSGSIVNRDGETPYKSILVNLLTEWEHKISREELYYENVVLNNTAYKYNTVKSFVGYLMLFCKESIFRNSHRSIKIESLLNSEQYLPEFFKSYENSLPDIQHQMTNAFYQLCGAIRVENVYHILRLKELHKSKFLLYLRNPEERWLDPMSVEDIQDYYFIQPKNDPIIVNANKFLRNSRHYLLGQTEAFDHLKTSISNFLKASTILLNKSTSKVEDGLINKIHEILRTITGIIQPGIENTDITIGTPESKLGYMLCIKYSNRYSDGTASENTYVISSDASSTGKQLNHGGLIMRLMNGLFTSKSLVSIKTASSEPLLPVLDEEQSLISGIYANNQWLSFENNYFWYSKHPNRDRAIKNGSFESLINEDINGRGEKPGLPLLAQSNLALFLRLSDVNEGKLKEGKCVLEGKAVLVITASSNDVKKDSHSFLNTEKIRLLLLMKEDLVRYLNGITSNNTFYQLFKSVEILNYQSTLKHGLEDYFVYQDKILENKNFDEINLTILKVINDAIKGQITAYDIKKNLENKQYSSGSIAQRIAYILESPLVAGKAISKANYSIHVKSGQHITMDSFVMEIIMLELTINAKRHSPNIRPGIIITLDDDYINIQNNTRPDLLQEQQRHRQGLELCKNICEELQYDFIRSNQNSQFEVTIKRKQHEKSLDN